ncbi:MAG: S8 family serine peptidase [Actinobacteria bacterium]|nr:S8 family serine peptidase [Actinomycetota bacterium]
MRAHTSRRFSRPAVVIGMVGLTLLGLRPVAAADDPYTNQQWNLTQIHAPSAWSVSTGGGVRIGIVDSGVNRNHEELSGQVADAVTCIDTGGDANRCASGGEDIDGHGTHVAGIAAAINGNGKGISGAAPTSQLVVARVFSPGASPGDDPAADLNDVRAGIRYVVQKGNAKVVNLSIGAEEQGFDLCGVFGSCQSPLKGAVEEAWRLGALPVIASGNSELYGTQGYGNLDAIVVGATGPGDVVAGYSAPMGTPSGAWWPPAAIRRTARTPRTWSCPPTRAKRATRRRTAVATPISPARRWLRLTSARLRRACSRAALPVRRSSTRCCRPPTQSPVAAPLAAAPVA